MTYSDRYAFVAQELQCVPRGGLHQNMYRSALEQALLNSFGSKPEIPATTEAAHAVALRAIRQHDPEFVPEIRS